MKPRHLKHARQWHRWSLLIVGLQFLFWTLGGLYFSLFNINDIHGDSLLKPAEPINIKSIDYPPRYLLQDYPHATDISYQSILGTPIVKFTDSFNSSKYVLNATDGRPLKKVAQNKARDIALSRFNGNAEITSITRLDSTPPSELSARHLPVWQVRFNDIKQSTLYISESSGEVVTKRHLWWRTFDLFWRLHILDPFSGEDIQNPWLTAASLLALFTTGLGVLLSIYLVLLPAARIGISNVHR